MKYEKPSEPAAAGRAGSQSVARGDKPKSADLGIAERRHFIRPLPVPEAVESDGDTDWATFQNLISEQPKD